MSSSSSKLTDSKNSFTLVPANKYKDTDAKSASVSERQDHLTWEILVSKVIISCCGSNSRYLPLYINEIIMTYLISVSLVKTLNTYNVRFFPFFKKNLPLLHDLAEAANHLVWGNPAEVKKILEKNKNPLLLTTNIEVVDHRGKGAIPPGSLLEIALYVEDIMMLDENNETMAGMIECFIGERCGLDEVVKQKKQAHQVIKIEKQNKVANRPEDLRILTAVFDALKAKTTDEKALELSTAMNTFQNHFLTTLGDEEIIMKGWQLAEEHYSKFGGYNTPKNNFVGNQLIGFMELRRLPVWIIQVLYSDSLDDFLVNRNRPLPRVDVQSELGIGHSAVAVVARSHLGVDCHLDCLPVVCWSMHPAGDEKWPHAFFQAFFHSKTLALEAACAVPNDIILDTNLSAISVRKK